MDESFSTWLAKTVVIAIFGLAISLMLRNTAFFNGVVGGMGYTLGHHLSEFPRASMQSAKPPPFSEKVNGFEIRRLYPVSDKPYQLASSQRYKIGIADLQMWSVRIQNGLVSVWSDGETMIEQCQSGEFQFHQLNGHYELVSCSATATVLFSKVN